jgi:hypothetical protein
MDAEYLLSLPQEELENIVRKKLEYLIKEGMVLQVDNKFRLKTEEELDEEMTVLLAN